MRTLQPLALILVLLAPMYANAERVALEQDGLTLNANLEKSGAWPDGPVILMTHGTLAHSGMEIMSTLQGLFSDSGVSSLAINLSLGLDDRAQAMYDCPTPHRHLHTDALGEIGAWAGWLAGQGAENIVLLGHSRGGNQSAWFAAEHKDIPVTGVILVAPATWNYQDLAEEYRSRYGSPLAGILVEAQTLAGKGEGGATIDNIGFIYCEDTSATADAVASYYADDPRFHTPHLLPQIDVPVLVISGSEDEVVKGLVDAVRPMADAGKVELAVVDGSDHFFRDLYADEVVELSLEFIGGQ